MKLLLSSLCILFFSLANGQTYFPPKIGNVWDTLGIARLGWCQPKVDSMLQFLENKGTKAFIVIKEGKIVLEKYYDSFGQDSVWYWASAGKSLASAMVGIAQQEGYLNINDKTSKYLGKGWTSCPKDKEDLITIKHQITMTTGLDESVSNPDCMDSICLQYKADAGTRWYYHNAPYTLTHNVLAAATGKNLNVYTYQKIASKIGMSGLWIKLGDNDIYFSKARDMARFGLLVLNEGLWQNDTIYKNDSYFKAMHQTSQSLNKSYGYLWWLNGKGEIVYPGSSTVFNKDLAPDAPKDMFAALGANDQKLYVIPSQNMVVVRMGNAADGPVPALSQFDNDLWIWMNKLKCTTNGLSDLKGQTTIYPNPAHGFIEVKSTESVLQWQLVNLQGMALKQAAANQTQFNIALGDVKAGIYVLILETSTGKIQKRIVVE